MKHSIVLLIGVGLVSSGCGGGEQDEPISAAPALEQAPAVEDERPEIPPEPAPAREPLGLIVSVEDLQNRLDSMPPRVIDVRAENDYSASHVPGAVRVDLTDWKSTSLMPDGLSNPDHWSERIGNAGIGSDTQVVVYAENPTDAARTWWILKYLGVDEVAMLDGGWSAWEESGAATDDQSLEVEPVEFVPEFQTERVAHIDELSSGESAATVIDTRTVAEFEGTGGPGERRGHIPGAVHLEWTEFMTEDGRLRSAAEIRAILNEHGISADDPQVVHCQSGGRAALAALALELAGFGKTRNYYCGWSEWSATEDIPIEAGATEQ